ncbi:hypothetical protein [Dyella sp.]|uniref:hypothetical protein n=1 Tax=Dyella sp. TaxID=1869338 RepID=UPI002ED1C1FE
MSIALAAGANDEHLQLPVPVGFQLTQQTVSGIEMLPPGESTDHWTRRITTQVYQGMAGPGFYDDYRARIEAVNKKDCDDTASSTINEDKVDGLPSHVWLQACRFKSPSSPPHYAFLRLVQSGRNAYVIMEELAHHPQDTETADAITVLLSAKVVHGAANDTAAPAPAHGASVAADGEILMQSIPIGFKVINQGKTLRGVEITEMIPQDDAPDNWTQKITSQVYVGMTDTSADGFKKLFVQGEKGICDHARTKDISDGMKYGHAFQVWSQTCQQDADHASESVYFKYIKGKDSSYIVRWTYRDAPTREQADAAIEYLDRVRLCDNRSPDNRCPP